MIVIVVIVTAALFAIVTLGFPGSSGSSGKTQPSAFGVSVIGHGAAVSAGPTTTASVGLPSSWNGWIFVFVGYVNSRAGGGSVTNVTDNLGDQYALRNSTGLTENFTEALYFSANGAKSTTDLQVSVTFGGGASAMGGSVAVVVVSSSGGLLYDYPLAEQSGVGGTATVDLATNPGGLVLFGVSGAEGGAPFTAGPDETLMDTAGAPTGPSGQGIGFATIAAAANSSGVHLSAMLSAPGVWNAIGLELWVYPLTDFHHP